MTLQFMNWNTLTKLHPNKVAHEEGIKRAVAAALTIFHIKNGKDKEFIEKKILDKYYPYWAVKSYEDIHDDFTFNSTCLSTVRVSYTDIGECTSFLKPL